VELEYNGKTLRIFSSTSDTEIKTREDDEFPSIPTVESGTKTEISTQKIASGFKSVWYAASPSSMKPELSSVYMSSKEGDLYFVATDSFRLAEKRIVTDTVSDFPGVIVPVKNIQECVKIFSGIEGDVNISI
jgi:DNA polymerase-3 subunit beta